MTQSPSLEAEIGRLIDNVCADHRVDIESAVREAFAMGWRAHAAAVAKLDNPPTLDNSSTDTDADINLDIELEHLMGGTDAAPARPTTDKPPSVPAPETQPAMIFDIVRNPPFGKTSMQVIDVAQRIDRHISPAAVRTSLHRLKLKHLIYSASGKWFPALKDEGNAGASAPA